MVFTCVYLTRLYWVRFLCRSFLITYQTANPRVLFFLPADHRRSTNGHFPKHRERFLVLQSITAEKSIGLYWQLYKSLAAYRMAVREEKRKEGSFSYDWILRARFDVAWVRPLPPLRSFSRDSAWFNRQYW